VCVLFYGVLSLIKGKLLFISRFGVARFTMKDDGIVFYAVVAFIILQGLIYASWS